MKTLPCLDCGIAVEVRDGARRAKCAQCRAAYKLAWAQRNPQAISAAASRYYENGGRNAQAKWAAENPRKRESIRLKYRYGITLDEYEQMLANQGGGCAICGVAECPRWGRMSVDHNHVTKAVRGLLCNACNALLGNAHDCPIKLQKAADYLKHYSSKALANA